MIASSVEPAHRRILRAPKTGGSAQAKSGPDAAPPLKWAGGKRWLVPTLRKLYAPFRARRLVEPFVGGLSVTLGLDPNRALLCDANPHAINLYSWIQRGLSLDIRLENDRETYYPHRTRFNSLVRAGLGDSKEAAELFYYLNRTCYNGLCRFNSAGDFNVPMGRYKHITYRRDFSDLRPTLSRWKFLASDFEALAPTSRDFVYADPPYDVEFTHYARGGFSWADQQRLAEWLGRLDGPVVASNEATNRVVELYHRHGFQLTFLRAPRMISCNGDRTPALEMLATKGMGGL